ncbi:glycosyltransferase family 39 protein [Acidisoma cellulosilytica]|uniref:Glycosyltransferase family 39 protein n=1 Tax=Acidisoma cellulosilyticum TaxID=2802395 RepID=A0A963YYS2_9PROT|nr:glycosyltransferase family 39 protein [Acidisoma cellulosilyticum]MCB8879634.1 glycosyltransferase family 39 protein [Acidisoma cellulosilyticum]
MPDRSSSRSDAGRFALALGLLTLLRLVVAAAIPVSPDEAYYWLWAQAPAAGYYDHPFMVAAWVHIGTGLFGNTGLGIRLLGPISTAIGSYLILDAARRLGYGRGYGAAILLNATLLFGAGSVLMTPDTPLLFFWILTLWTAARIAAGGSGWWWIATGAAAGLALDSKYTAALLLAGIGLWALLTPLGRRWLLRDVRPWAGLVLALAVFLPVILWNADHHWVSFAKQGGRTADFHPARALQFLGELIGGQLGLATPIIFILCVLGLWRATAIAIATRNAAPSLLVALGLLPALVFIQHALGDRVQGNWPEILYPAAVIAAIGLPCCQRWLKPGAILGFALTLIVYVQAIASPIPMGGASDPTIRLLGGWHKLGSAAEIHARQTGAQFIAVDEYGLGSELALRLPKTIPLLADDPRWQYFNLPGPATAGLRTGATGLLIRTERRHDAPDATPWSSMRELGSISRSRNGRVGESYKLYAVTLGPSAPALLARLPSGASP